MHPEQRLVTHLPLAGLWNEFGPLPVRRERTLGCPEIRALLQAGLVQFVVADPGRPLRWVPTAECRVFWKLDVRPHVVEDPERPFDVFSFPEGYAYVASEWIAEDMARPPIVLLERHH